MSKPVSLSCLGVAAALAASAVFAQQFPQPEPEHARLKAMEGSWDVVSSFGGQEMRGTTNYKMDLGGLWLVGEYRSGDGSEFSGRSLESYDATKQKYVSVWVDSMSTSPMMTEGTYDAAGKVKSMAGQGPGFDGQSTKYRTTLEHAGDDRFTVTLYVIPTGGTEELMGTIAYTRKK